MVLGTATVAEDKQSVYKDLVSVEIIILHQLRYINGLMHVVVLPPNDLVRMTVKEISYCMCNYNHSSMYHIIK